VAEPVSPVMASLGPAHLKQLIRERLGESVPYQPARGPRISGMPPEISRGYSHLFSAEPTPAAVLVPLVDHTAGLSILLTQRSADLRHHAGQISFPGGRMESKDAGPIDAALRETEEEIGLSREHVEVVGFLDDHLILSGYRITPVVAFVRPGFELRLDPTEVVETFEVPLSYVLNPAHHVPRRRRLGTHEIELHDIDFEGHNIWGATAGMLLTLYEVLAGTAGATRR
jgi:8-oxo-dGTP pyrophosphatase MutT (NUDIX family)